MAAAPSPEHLRPTGRRKRLSSVTLSATDFLSNQKVKLSFVDAKGTKTKLAPVTTSASGAFSVSVAVPGGAARGKAEFKAAGVGGLTAANTFTVTAHA